MVVGWKIFSLQKCQGSRFQEDTERRVYEDGLHLDKRPVPHAAMNEEYLRENVISKKKTGYPKVPGVKQCSRSNDFFTNRLALSEEEQVVRAAGF